ncbi:MAG: hypothetical protein PHG44_04465 [Lentisphaeria bacterium]|jgi:DNA-binding transcriptional regulator/RsmH inhibitor MraZ|nr:hypothetical protein [Lentisphaeria bacterium]MDY0175872.1 hypothetical protein [Lentisphaeria bacterium]NLZ60951.1 hypothetical protein [Lentisphaerota bacterium]
MSRSSSNRKRFFSGTHPVSVDAQRRIAMPKSWRLPEDTEDTQFFLVPGRNKRIFVITEERAEKLFDSAERISVLDGDGMGACEDIASKMQIVNLDKQGRFALDQALATHAGISNKAVFLGAIFCGSIVAPENKEELSNPSDMSLDHLQRIEEKASALKASSTI